MENLVDRLVRALKLTRGVFAEIGADQSATAQAILITAVATAISALTGEGNLIGRIVGTAVFSIVGLFIWTGILFLIGKIFNAQGGYLGLLRGIGYSAAPGAIGVIPFLGFIGGIYSIVLQVRAVEEIGQVSVGKAAAIVLIPLAVLAVIGFILFAAVIATIIGIGTASS